MLKTLSIPLLFGFFAFCAWTGFPASYFGETMPSKMDLLQGFIALATDPLGPRGGAALFVAIGALLTWVAMRGQRRLRNGAQRSPRTSRRALTPPEDGVEVQRRGDFGAHVPAAQPPETAPIAEPEHANLPAWSLQFFSPYEDWAAANSWIGGSPIVPDDFDWPRDSEGMPLHFVAQVDCASLAGPDSAGIPVPQDGALLFFAGLESFVAYIREDAMALAEPRTSPPDLPPLEELGYCGEGREFGLWPVRPVFFLSDGSKERPPAFPDPFGAPADWMTHWGIARIEAETLLVRLQNDLGQAEWNRDYRARSAESGQPTPDTPVTRAKASDSDYLLGEGKDLVTLVEQWIARCAAEGEEETIDAAARDRFLAVRRAAAECLSDQSQAKRYLLPRVEPVLERLIPRGSGMELRDQLNELPAVYRPLVEKRLTDWRGHRLFGIEPEFPNNPEDMTAMRCVFSIHSDALLGTESEHDYGFSAWVPREQLERGEFQPSQLVRHCAV